MSNAIKRLTLRQAMARMIRYLVVIAIAVAAISIPVCWTLYGMDGLISALVGSAVTAVLVLLTWWIDKTVLTNPDLMTALIYGGYLIKLVVVLGTVILVREVQFADPRIIFVTLIVAVIALTFVQVFVLGRARVLTIDQPLNEAE